MYISLLALDHFRSWNHCIIKCNPTLNILYGINGLGKTNIVEAIEVISTGTSHRSSATLPLIERGFTSATIRLNVENLNFNDSDSCNSNSNDSDNFDSNDSNTYEATLTNRGANRARINSGKSVYMRDIVGIIPSVSFTPRDQFLVSGDPSQRRTFLDQACSLLVPGYAKNFQEYKHIAKQRTALLKQLGNNSSQNYSYSENSFENNSENSSFYLNNTLSGLEVWTGRFIEVGIFITQSRQKVVDELSKYFSSIVENITYSKQKANIVYNPSFEEVGKNNDEISLKNYASKISEHFQRLYAGEVSRGCNLIGPHRDDFSLLLDGFDAKDFASNGESWTLALALKISLLKALENKNQQKPIIILDDVFAQLDENRRLEILKFIKNQGQVFITVASLNDIPQNSLLSDNSFIDVSSLIPSSENSFENKENIDEDHKSIIDDILLQRVNSSVNNSVSNSSISTVSNSVSNSDLNSNKIDYSIDDSENICTEKSGEIS